MGNRPGGAARRRPFARTALVWTCVFALAVSGCAENRLSVPGESSAAKKILALAVIPSGDVPEISVVRIGSSRVLGALRGAGKGFLDGAGAIARGTGGMGSCSGQGCAAVAVLMAALIVGAGTVGAVIGGVQGSRTAAPYRQTSDADDATRNRLASLRIQEGIAALVAEDAGRRLPFPVTLKAAPPGLPGGPEEMLRDLQASGVDAALRVGIVRVGFESPVGKDPPASIVVTLHAKITRTGTGETILEKTIDRRSAPMPGAYWVNDDFLGLIRELDDGVRDLSKRCVDEILAAGLASGFPR